MATQDVTLGRDPERDFRGFADEILLGRKIKKPQMAPKSRSSWTGADVKNRKPVDYKGKGTSEDTYARLQAIARKRGQVMVKITGGGKTTRTIKNHFDYLSRNGELILHDQDGNPIEGREAVEALAWGWKHSGPMMDESGKRKEAINVVFSMPEGTDPRALHDAVKAAAEIEFAGHLWVMVQHFDEPHVHAHVSVKIEGVDGVRLNPRKEDLQRWRERFAYELRERGVEAEATRRAARMQQEKINKPWAVTRLEERGQPSNARPVEEDRGRIEAWKKSQARVLANYEGIIEALRNSQDAGDCELAQELRRTADEKAKGVRDAVKHKPSPERI